MCCSMISLIIASLLTGFCHAISRDDFETEFFRRLNSDPQNMLHSMLTPNVHSPDTTIEVLVSSEGTNQRVEAMSAVIRNPLPAPGTRVDFSPWHTQYMRNVLGGREGDERGHILAHSLGGPANVYNLFPQHRCSNRNYNERHALLDWYGLEEEMRNHMDRHTDNTIEFRVMFNFPDRSVGFPAYNRPSSIDVNARLLNRYGILEDEFDFRVENRPGVFVLPSWSKIYKNPPTTTPHWPLNLFDTVVNEKIILDVDKPSYICHFWTHKP